MPTPKGSGILAPTVRSQAAGRMARSAGIAAAAIALLGASGFIGPAVAAEPLVRGGDFEAAFSTIADIAATWTPWGIDTQAVAAGITRDESDPHGGRACLRVFRPADPREWRGVVANSPFSNALRPAPHTRYTLSCWARSDRPGPIRVSVIAYRSVRPIVQGPVIVSRDFEVDETWTECRLSFASDLDFYAADAPHIWFAFMPVVGRESLAHDRTLWLDDIAVASESLGDDLPKLVNPATLAVPPLPLRLEPGSAVELEIDAARALRPTNRMADGLAIAGLARWDGPLSTAGDDALPPAATAAVRELRIPFSRFYGLLDDEPFESLEAGLDQAAALLDRLGIPRATSVMELESVRADTRLAPADWRRAAAHARDKGLGFRHWEIGNEVYTSIWNAGGDAFASPSDYAEHVIAVSRAIREAQPDARIGISIKPDHIGWGNRVLAETAGHYDFVCPHLYDFTKAHEASFEDVVITGNHARLDEALELRALLRAYNPDRRVTIYDTEWGLHSPAASGGKAWTEPRNANIVGTLHRAVRMLYYAREEVVEGAAGWNLFSSSRNPGFLVVARDRPERRTMLYWLHYHFSRHLGEQVVELAGQAPFHADPGNPEAAGHPLTPALATLADDGQTLFVMLVNGSWSRDLPAQIAISNFPTAACRAVVLRHDDPAANPLLERDEDFVGDLPVAVADGAASFTLPAHSVVFLRFRRDE
jgi:hypothetical protein